MECIIKIIFLILIVILSACTGVVFGSLVGAVMLPTMVIKWLNGGGTSTTTGGDNI